MLERDVDTWDEFLEEIGLPEAHRSERKASSGTYVSELLFRGQPDASLKLSTTLERHRAQGTSVQEYVHLIRGLMPEIETHTDRKWDIPDLGDVESAVLAALPLCQPVTWYEYMAYLRHHGFPSPLLDWTTSPFIAAYFAFSRPCDNANRVSVYAYMEDAGQGKSGLLDEAQFYSLGSTIKVHQRHFLQRSQYTFCIKRPPGGKAQYCPHEEAFDRHEVDQDVLWKFTIPKSERRTALAHLWRYNISGVSLFGSDESLMESLALREFVIGR